MTPEELMKVYPFLDEMLASTLLKMSEQGKLEKFYQESCLVEQAFIKDPTLTIKDLLSQKIAKIGENISVRRFTRYELGQA